MSPTEEYSAALFRRDAEKLIAAIQKRKRVPLVTAGTGLYLRALLDGLFDEPGGTPPRDDRFRAQLAASQARHGGAYLHECLTAVDPAAAGHIHANDTRRLVRALEVYERTRRPISQLQPARSGLRARFDVPIYLIDRGREDLYARIDGRVGRMMSGGLSDEVKRLLKRPLGRTASMALGIRELREALEGRATLDEAVEALKRNTRRYAKRQLSWFRHERGVVPVPVGPDEKPSETAGRVLKLWEKV